MNIFIFKLQSALKFNTVKICGSFILERTNILSFSQSNLVSNNMYRLVAIKKIYVYAYRFYSKLPQTRQPVALPSHSEHQPHIDHNCEGAHSLPSAEELQKNIQETKNDPLGSVMKPWKDVKTPPKQSAPVKVSKRKSTAKSKAEGNQAMAKLEDQGN
jgi:hypothetical protein